MCCLMTLTAVLEKAEEGGFTIYLKEFPGVISEGETQNEAVANLADAFETYLEWKLQAKLEETKAQSDSERLELVVG